VQVTGRPVQPKGLILESEPKFGGLVNVDLRSLTSQVYDSSFFPFVVVGTVGFLTDAVFVYSFVFLLGLNYFVGRLLSFSIAVGVTLLLNRAWTFRLVSDRPISRSILYIVSQVLVVW
jgi:putative flippase GtrA